MTRPKPPYLIYKIRNGRTDWYYWKRPNAQIRLRYEYGTREFWDAYEQASRGSVKSTPVRSGPKLSSETLAWLIERYRETGDWSCLSQATRRQRENIFRRITTANPTLGYKDVDRALVVQTRDAKKDTPSEANNFLDAFRGLFRWAVDTGFVDSNPVAGVKNLRRPKTGGFRAWTEEDICAFQRRWPIGTRERLCLEILLNTGLRRGDVARLGRQHIRQGRIRIVTEKTSTQIDIPAPTELLKVIDKTHTGDLVFVASKTNSKPMNKASLGNWFRRASLAAGVNGNCHGLRKAAATRLAEAGATIPELNAVFGWVGSTQALGYVEKANRRLLADNAAAKLSRDN